MFVLFSTCDSKEVLEHYESIHCARDRQERGSTVIRPVKGPTIYTSLLFLIALQINNEGPDFHMLESRERRDHSQVSEFWGGQPLMSILEFLIPLEIILRPEIFPPILWVLGSIKTFPFTQ